MHEITKPIAKAWNGEPVRNTVDEVMRILLPMFALYPQVVMKAEGQAVYIDMIRDIAPDKLATSVRLCMAECKWLPTVAEIRERYESLRQTAPPRITEQDLPDFNYGSKLYRESSEERRERLARMDRRERLYGH